MTSLQVQDIKRQSRSLKKKVFHLQTILLNVAKKLTFGAITELMPRYVYLAVWLSSSTAVLPQGCSYPLGMENKQIPDAQITASSEYNSAHGASNGRLNFQSGGGKTGAWSARTSDVNQWLKVDMGKRKMITGIKTQGRAEANQWVTSYTISYSDDGATFTSYAQSQVWSGTGLG